jgi:putative Mg2+ transporter-C (MgtC) family protein
MAPLYVGQGRNRPRIGGTLGHLPRVAQRSQRVGGHTMDLTAWLAGETTGLAPLELFLRLAIAGVFGAVIGFDRQVKNKPAGLRTHTLVSLAAALFTLITFELYFDLTQRGEAQGADPIRIIEAVTSGVAFLAAGAIIRSGGNIRGLTTGANMWLAGAIGVACGAGFYTLAVLGALFSVIIITLLHRFERRYLPNDAQHEADS